MSWISSALALPLGLTLAYVVLRIVWPQTTAWVSHVLVGAHTPVTSVSEDNFLWIGSTLPLPNLPPLSLMGALDVAGVCAGIMILMALLKKNEPLALWVQANVLILLLTALWAFFMGNCAYDGKTFMELVERTSVIMILCSPIFAVVVASLLPFSPLERSLLFALLITFNFAMSVLRLAAFSLLLSHFGPIAEANLYMFFGPLIDVVYFISGYSMCVVLLSRRIQKDEQVWEWL